MRLRSWAARCLFLAASGLVHVVILAPPRAALEIEPGVARCQAGEAVRVVAVLRTGARRSPVASAASWSVRTGSARLLAPGVFRCEEEGEAVVMARKGDLEAQARIAVGPPVMMVDARPPPPAPEARPEPKPPEIPRQRPPRQDPVPIPAPRTTANAEPAPTAAPAAEILTAESPPEAPEEDVAVSEPGSERSGSGVVAPGGTAETGAPGARADGVIGGAGTGPSRGVPAPPDRSRPPAIDDRDPCRGYFPDDAHADEAVVEIDVDVAPDGRVRRASVLAETPQDQGFGSAARRCFGAMRLVPARDRGGLPTAGRMTFRFRFAR